METGVKKPKKAAVPKATKAAETEPTVADAGTLALRLDRLAKQLESVDVWTRRSAKARQPRLDRNRIAAVALRLADTDGLDGLSMRRIAAELGVGTMSLYHYVRTKDELLTLVLDGLLAEVIVPAATLVPSDWRAAMTLIAGRTRAALQRHPWVLDLADEPAIGPNAIRHFDQTLGALRGLDATLTDKLDLLTAVDEFVFGYCLQSRTRLRADEAENPALLSYIQSLLAEGEYPALASMVGEVGTEVLWVGIQRQIRDPGRFDRNLARLLDGFHASLTLS